LPISDLYTVDLDVFAEDDLAGVVENRHGVATVTSRKTSVPASAPRAWKC
jgi:hypothetical protein